MGSHAWRALGQLEAVEAAEPLVYLFQRLADGDWIRGELPVVFSMMGPETIPVLDGFLGDQDVEETCRLSGPACLERIAKAHPAHRNECVDVLTCHLERYETNGRVLNAFLISSLIDLDAIEAIGLIRKAFSADRVDLLVAGDIEDVEIDMGLRTARSSPRTDPNPFGTWLGLENEGIELNHYGRHDQGPSPACAGPDANECLVPSNLRLVHRGIRHG